MQANLGITSPLSPSHLRASLHPNGNQNTNLALQPGMPPTPEEIRRLREMPATDNFGDPLAFAGGPPPMPRDPGVAPSRVLLQQLYDAGMVDALPEDVQMLLRRRGPPRGPSATPVDLAIEARDPRLASDVVIQFLAFRHHDTLNAPAALQSIYFTFQFYHFPPTTSDMAFLVQVSFHTLHWLACVLSYYRGAHYTWPG